VCKHFGTCGGCALQHWSLAEYHLWKRSLVADALAQAGIVAPIADLIDAHGAEPMTFWKSVSRRRERITSSQSTIAPFWRPRSQVPCAPHGRSRKCSKKPENPLISRSPQ